MPQPPNPATEGPYDISRSTYWGPDGAQHTLLELAAELATLAASFRSLAASIPPPVTTIAASGTSQAVAFAASGNNAYDITLSANCTISLSGGVFQHLTLVLRQPASGATYSVTLPGAKYAGGTAPAVSTTNGQVSVITYATPDGGATIFGGL